MSDSIFFAVLFLHFSACCYISVAQLCVCLFACFFAFWYYMHISVLALFFAVILCIASLIFLLKWSLFSCLMFCSFLPVRLPDFWMGFCSYAFLLRVLSNFGIYPSASRFLLVFVVTFCYYFCSFRVVIVFCIFILGLATRCALVLVFFCTLLLAHLLFNCSHTSILLCVSLLSIYPLPWCSLIPMTTHVNLQ